VATYRIQKLKNLTILILLFCFTLHSWAQDKFWIEFSDKGEYIQESGDPQQFLSPNALNRRAYFDIPIDYTDYPLNSSYIAKVENLEAKVEKNSKWLNGIIVQTSNINFVAELAQYPFVKRVVTLNTSKSQLSDKFQLDESEVDTLPILAYGFAASNIEMLKGEYLHELGFQGQTIDIGVMDNGFQLVNTNRFFDTLNILNKIHGAYNFVDNSTDVFSNGDHGAYVMSTLAANIKDTLIGTAPMGNYYLFTTEDNNNESLAEEINWALAAEWVDSALGTWVVLSTSLGYSNGFNNSSTNHSYADMDGNTTIITKASDLAAKKGMLVVNSAGNEGTDDWKFITAPADGDSVLAVGAVDAEREPAEFSSYGPSSDGQIKPNVSALGRRVVAAKYNGTLQTINGTSFSCPITAGLAACLWQAFPDKNNMEVIEAIEQSAHLYFSPEDQLGYGIPNFEKAYKILELREVTQSSGLILYPNPTSDILNIVFIEKSEGAYDLVVADMAGKVWIRQQDNDQVTLGQLSVKDLPKGVYLLFVKQGKNRYRQKFIKR
jgi:subtilisin family serine protease